MATGNNPTDIVSPDVREKLEQAVYENTYHPVKSSEDVDAVLSVLAAEGALRAKDCEWTECGSSYLRSCGTPIYHSELPPQDKTNFCPNCGGRIKISGDTK